MRLGDKSLDGQFPRLYNPTFSQIVTVQFVKNRGIDGVEFIRTLHDETSDPWEELKHLVDMAKLKGCNDRVIWTLNNKNKFMVKDMYLHLKASTLVRY